MHAPLNELHGKLSQLKQRRRWLRWIAAGAAFLAVVFWLLLGLFAIDLLFETDLFQRLVLLSIGAVILVWAASRFVWPLVTVREHPVDLALLVEKQAGVDNDLVAALQFSDPEANTWGARSFRDVVIRGAGHLAERPGLFQIESKLRLSPRLRLLVIGVAVASLTAFWIPDHFTVFLQRLALSSRHYPARTVLDEIVVNGDVVYRGAAELRPDATRVPEFERVEFVVSCSNQIPAAGRLIVSEQNAEKEHVIALEPTLTTANSNQRIAFSAVLPTLVDSVEYQIFLGDTWTEPAVIELISRPQLNVEVLVTPPVYARALLTNGGEGQRVVDVLEGSQVVIQVDCTNDKQLQYVTATVNSNDAIQGSVELSAVNADGRTWRLSGQEWSELSDVRRNLTIEVGVTDIDGLSSIAPLHIDIRVFPDRLPQASLWSESQTFAPQAAPQIFYRAEDDYGLQGARVTTQMIPGGEVEQPSVAAGTDERVVSHRLDGSAMPVLADSLPLVGETRLDLGARGLSAGDALRVILEVTDYRGSEDGRTVQSDPITLFIVDPIRVLEKILENDWKTVEALDQALDWQVQLPDSENLEEIQTLQQRIQQRTGSVVTEILNEQLQRLRDNRMEGLPAFGDIKQTHESLTELLRDEMAKTSEELVKARQQSLPHREAMDRGRLRTTLQVLTQERDRTRRRLQVAELAGDFRELIDRQTAVQEDTMRLSETPDEQRVEQTLEVLDDQKDARVLFQQLETSLNDVSKWNNRLSDAASKALAEIRERAVGQRFEDAEAEIGRGRLVAAAENQNEIVERLSSALQNVEAARGIDPVNALPLLEIVTELRERQEVLQRLAGEANSLEALDGLTERQGAVRSELGGLSEELPEGHPATSRLEPASSAASRAEQHLFEGDAAQAIAAQGEVVQQLRQLEQLLEQTDIAEGMSPGTALTDEIGQLERLDESLEKLLEQQEAVVEQAGANPESAGQLEQEVADELGRQAARSPLPENVAREVKQAAEAADKAATALGQANDAKNPQSANGRQAAVDAQAQLQQASREASAALSQARNQQQAANGGDGQLQPSPEMSAQEAAANQTPPASDASSSTGTAPSREGNRRTSDQGRGAAGGAVLGSEIIQDQPWFAELPPEVREAIRSRVRQQPPKGYEQRLRRYFQADVQRP
jgi:hypothetical protein